MTPFPPPSTLRRWTHFTVALCALYCISGCKPSFNFSAPPNMERALALRNAMGGGASSAGSASAAALKAQPTGWATLKGQITLNGSPPAKVALPVAGSDAGVCAPSGKTVYSEEFVGESGGGIKNILVYLTTKIDASEPWTHPTMKPQEGGEFLFDQKECVFLSHVFAVKSGEKLRIKNSDPVGHNTNIQGTPVNQIVAANGGEITYVPQDELKSPTKVTCSIHPWMTAYMLVRDNGYYAVTDENGKFEIPNLPAGVELEFRLWQEKAGPLNGLDVDGKPVKKGKLVVTLPAEGMEFATTVDAATFQ